MSADAIDDPLRARENSSEEQEDGSTGETPLQNDLFQDSGTRGPCESPNTVADSQVKDDQHKKTHDNKGKTVTSKEHETGGKNDQYESPLVNSNQNPTQSDKSHEKGGESEVQQKTEKNETSQLKNKQSHEQVQRNIVYPKQESSTSKSYSEVTIGITHSPPPYNLRSRQNAAEMTLVNNLNIPWYVKENQLNRDITIQKNWRRFCSRSTNSMIPFLLQLDFHLYVHGDHPVNDVYLLLAYEEPILMHRVGSGIKLWHYQLPVSCDFQYQSIEYRYRVFIHGHDSKVPFFGRWLSKDDIAIDEICKRNTKSHVQYNVFHFPQDLRYYDESIPQSFMFYIKWLLNSVNMSSILKILQQIEEMHFTNFAAKHVREFIAWIVEQVIGPSVTDTQRLYLCVILGHLLHNCDRYFVLPYGHKSEKACDRILDSFNASVHAPFLSPSSLKILEKLASKLVEESSCPGWLNLAATFYSYLGVQYVVRKRHCSNMKYKCNIKEYQKLTDTLLKNISITDEDKSDHLNLLQIVLEIAPNNEAVVELFDNPDTNQFFASEAEKEDFFVKIFQDAHFSGTRRGVGAKLVGLLNIPEKLRRKLYRLVNSSLLDFVRSSDRLIVITQTSKGTSQTSVNSELRNTLDREQSLKDWF